MPCMSTLYIALKLHEYHGDKDFSSFTALTEKKSVSWSGSSSDRTLAMVLAYELIFPTLCVLYIV